MKHDNENSERNSGKTSENGQKPSAQHKPALSESEFLAQQANDAMSAISNTITDIKTDLVHAVDPRLWTKDHPWAMVAAAAVGGFAAACVAVPTKDEQALRKLEKLEDALFGAAKKREAKVKAETDGEHKPEKPGLMATLGKEVIGLIKPLLTSALAAGVSAKVSQPDTNGQRAAQGAGMGAGFGDGGTDAAS